MSTQVITYRTYGHSERKGCLKSSCNRTPSSVLAASSKQRSMLRSDVSPTKPSRSPPKAIPRLKDCLGLSPPRETDSPPPRPKSLYRQPGTTKYRSNSLIGSPDPRINNILTAAADPKQRGGGGNHFLSENRRRLHELWQASLSDSAINDNCYAPSPSPTNNFLTVGEFRPRAKSAGAQSSILKRENLLKRIADSRRKSPVKHTTFRNEVDVFYYDNKDTPSHGVERDMAVLKDDRIKSTTVQSRQFEVEEEAASAGVRRGSADVTDGVPMLKSSAFSDLQMDTIRASNSAHSKHDILRISLMVDESCLQSKTSVKAMSGGRSLIVITYRGECEPTETPSALTSHSELKDGECDNSVKENTEKDRELHQFVEKISLPKEVDPYSVRAFVYKNGNLVIEAPILKSP